MKEQKNTEHEQYNGRFSTFQISKYIKCKLTTHSNQQWEVGRETKIKQKLGSKDVLLTIKDTL